MDGLITLCKYCTSRAYRMEEKGKVVRFAFLNNMVGFIFTTRLGD